MSKKNGESPYYKDFEFIIETIAKFHIKLADDFKNKQFKDKNDYLYMLNLGKKNPGNVIIGRAGSTKFYEIAKRALKINPDLAQRVNPKIMQDAIQHVFVTKIILSKEDLTDAVANKIVSSAVAHVRKNKLKTLCHFLPCVLPLDSDGYSFRIGPVSFVQTDKFLAEKESNLKKYTKECKKYYLELAYKKNPDLDEAEKRKIYRFSKNSEMDLKTYYSKYPWIASIQIENFEDKKSEEVAGIGIRAALNILRLFFPINHAESIRSHGPNRREDQLAYLREDADGEIHISSIKNFSGGDEKGWVKRLLLDDSSKDYIQMLGSLISFLISGRPIPLLYQRYINAMWWYAESLLHDIPYIKIISLSNALESFLGPGDYVEGQPISSTIAERARLLLEIKDPGKEWDKKIKKFYDIRSDLVHGRTAAFNPDVTSQIGIGQHMVQMILIEGITWTQYMAHDPNCRDDLKIINKKLNEDLPKYLSCDLPGISKTPDSSKDDEKIM